MFYLTMHSTHLIYSYLVDVGIYICGLREITYILCLELRPLVWAINLSVYSMWGSVIVLPPNIRNLTVDIILL